MRVSKQNDLSDSIILAIMLALMSVGIIALMSFGLG